MDFLKDNKNILYWVIGILFAVILIFYLINRVAFIFRSLGDASGSNLINTGEVVKFNFDKLKDLKL